MKPLQLSIIIALLVTGVVHLCEAQEKLMISNVNFGTFLTPQHQIVNSGSTWTHTFIVDDVLDDPIPPALRRDFIGTWEGCAEIARAFAENTKINGDRLNISFDTVRLLSHQMCDDVLSVSATYNQQKRMLIKQIDSNLQSIRNFVFETANLRDGKGFLRLKRAPFEFVGYIGDKLFGIARKKAVKLALRNHEILKSQVNDSFGKIVASQKSLESVIKLQDKTLNSTYKAIKYQQKALDNLRIDLRETDSSLRVLEAVSRSEASYAYNLIAHQAGLQTSLIKATISTLGSLNQIQDRTHRILLGLQRLASGYLPIGLISASQVEEALEMIDVMLLKPRLQFHLAIRNIKYYYGMQCASFVMNGQLSVVLHVPLSTVGALFQTYAVNAIKLPMSTEQNQENDGRYTRVSGHSEYFAMSLDGEHYLEMSSRDMATCKGIIGFPFICNPVRVMSSVRSRPSCTLALYNGNVTMMKTHCKREFYEQSQPDAQIYQIGQGELLVTATEGEFIKHCAHGPQMVTIQACKLCTIKLPCGCNLKSKDLLVPPLLDGCLKNSSTAEIKYPINLLTLSEILSTAELDKYNGSVTFNITPRMNIPEIKIKRITHEGIAELDTNIMDLSRVMSLAKVNEDIYLNEEAYVGTPHTLAEKLVSQDLYGMFQLAFMGMNVISALFAYIGYKKGCTSATTAAAALQSVIKIKKTDAQPAVLPGSGEVHPEEVMKEIITDDGFEYWTIIKIMILIGIIVLFINLTIYIVHKIYQYLSLHLLITPLDGTPASTKLCHVYISISNGIDSCRLYIYSIRIIDHNLRLLQKSNSRISIIDIQRCPNRIFSFGAGLTNNIVLLKTVDGKSFKLPRRIYLPVTLVRRVRKIIKGQYTSELYVGNAIYRVLVPEFYDVEESWFLGGIRSKPDIRKDSNPTTVTPDLYVDIDPSLRTQSVISLPERIQATSEETETHKNLEDNLSADVEKGKDDHEHAVSLRPGL